MFLKIIIMKTVLTIFLIFTSLVTNAQSAYENGMNKAFSFWQENKIDEASNLFERIANVEKDNWLPHYYAAQINIIKTFSLKDANEIESRLNKARTSLNHAKSFSENNAEITIMEALLYTAWVAYNPSVYGMTYSQKVEALYLKAKQIEPKNPRATLYHAEWKMGAAKFFGQDPQTFCSEVDKAKVYFEQPTSTIPFYPKWGKNEVKRIQQNCI